MRVAALPPPPAGRRRTRKCRPSGRNSATGPRHPLAGRPPPSGFRDAAGGGDPQRDRSPARRRGWTPSGLHDPSAPVGGRRSSGGPLETSTCGSLPPATNATKRLSGDQIGGAAPSVPARGRASSLVERAHPNPLAASARHVEGDQAPSATPRACRPRSPFRRRTVSGRGRRHGAGRQAIPSPRRRGRRGRRVTPRARGRAGAEDDRGRPRGAALRDPLQLGHDVPRALPAVLRGPSRATSRHVVEGRRGHLLTLAIDGGCADTIAAIRLSARLPAKASSPCHLVEDGAEAKMSVPRVGRLASSCSGACTGRCRGSCVLGQRLVQRAQGGERPAPAASSPVLARAEVEELRPRLREHDVGRLQVAVDDAVPVGRREGGGDLDVRAEHSSSRERPPGRRSARDSPSIISSTR